MSEITPDRPDLGGDFAGLRPIRAHGPYISPHHRRAGRKAGSRTSEIPHDSLPALRSIPLVNEAQNPARAPKLCGDLAESRPRGRNPHLNISQSRRTGRVGGAGPRRSEMFQGVWRSYDDCRASMRLGIPPLRPNHAVISLNPTRRARLGVNLATSLRVRPEGDPANSRDLSEPPWGPYATCYGPMIPEIPHTRPKYQKVGGNYPISRPVAAEHAAGEGPRNAISRQDFLRVARNRRGIQETRSTGRTKSGPKFRPIANNMGRAVGISDILGR